MFITRVLSIIAVWSVIVVLSALRIVAILSINDAAANSANNSGFGPFLYAFWRIFGLKTVKKEVFLAMLGIARNCSELL